MRLLAPRISASSGELPVRAYPQWDQAPERSRTRASAMFSSNRTRPAAAMCVPETSPESCDQAIFVDQGAVASLFPDPVLVEIDRLG